MSDEVGKTVQAPGTPTAAQKEQNNQLMKQQEAKKAKSKFGNLKKKGPLKNRSYFDSVDHLNGRKLVKCKQKI